MKKVVAVLRRALRPLAPLARESRRDDGVIGLIIVIALLAAAAALIATTARQNKDAEVRRLSGNATSVKLLKNSISSFFLTDADGAGAGTAVNSRIPCPDASFPPNGTADGTTTCTANTGVVPWLTLGLSEDDVTDTYGNYFTYAVSGDSTARAICTSVTNQYDTGQIEYTGGLNAVTDTEARLSSQTAGQGTPYYFAFISHGKNGLGAISRSGARRSSPTSTSEIQNCPATNSNCTDPSALTVITGPKDTTDSTYFDDNVYIGSAAQLTEMCASLAPGKGKVNAEVNESFTNTAVGALPTTLAAPPTGTGATTQQSTVAGNTTNKVLQFAGANTAITTATTVFNTAERARYISFQWRPTTAPSSTAGVSIGLRATAANRNTTTAVGTFDADIFNASTLDGITIRYFEDTANNANGSVANSIYVCDNITATCDSGAAANRLAVSSGTFTIVEDAAYNVEAYDDGTNIWARITQVTDASNNTIVNSTNTAFVTFSTVPLTQQDLTGNNSILLINYSDATVEVDDLLVGRASMAVAFDGTNDIIETAGDSHDTTTGNLTLETWIRPDTLPSGSAKATLFSKWTESAPSNAAQAYRLYLTNGGALALDLAGDDTAGGTNIITTTINFGGYQATVGEWAHIAVSFDKAEQAAKLYVNRELISRVSSALFDTAAGINDGTAAFSIGAERNNGSTIVNRFDGAMTDVRVWNTPRTAQQIFANYNARIALVGSVTGLILNWTLDSDSGATFTGGPSLTAARTSASTTSNAASADGDLKNGAAYIASHQQFIPALSTSFCAASSVVGAFECDYRFNTQSGGITVPSNLSAVYVKAWGGGGGGYDASALLYPASGNGGGAGYSAGRVQNINGVANPISAALGLRVDVGGGGGSSSGNNGAAGGGASGLWRDVDSTNTVTAGDFAGVIGGGGGGASYGDDNLGQGVDCRSAGACGPGGGGGGPFNFTTLSRDQTSRAADSNDNTCGGRGGDNAAFGANPPDTTDNNCESGGDPDPTTTVGASGAGTAVGGVSIIGAGGAGFNGVAPEIGAGGGGGGVRVSAMTSGGGEAGGYDLNGAGQAGTTDANGTGFGAGGGAGFVDTGASGVIGAAGSALTPGGTTDPNYALATCTIVTCPTTTPGRGGESGSTTGKTGAVILKW